MTGRVEGKVAFITGAARGHGLAGGLWHEVITSGRTPVGSSTPGSGGNGY